MKTKELLMIAVSAIITMLVAVIGVRVFAPTLLNIPTDLQLVKLSKEVPPFFDGVFRQEDLTTNEFLIPDPKILRAKPLYPDMLSKGPHDILGFRNRSIPVTADIIAIGDSQTYGNNVPIEQTWPNLLAESLSAKTNTLYNMSVGGWGAIQYLEIFPKALYFRPRVVVIAFYTGNDALNTFSVVYGDDRWKDLRLDASLTAADSPEMSHPSSEADIWPVKFSDGVATVFTPQRRHVANDESPAVRVGYRVMATVARKIGEMARKRNVQVVFTIIPTKELVYAPKVVKEKIVPPRSYPPLVNSEQKHLLELAEQLSAIPHTTYVDILRPLQKAARMNIALYPTNSNGHPDYLGYLEIARSLMATLKNSLPDKLQGGVELTIDSGSEEPLLYKGLIKNDFLYIFASDEVFLKNGWEQKDLLKISSRDIANIRFGGSVSMIAPLIFGPNKGPGKTVE